MNMSSFLIIVLKNCLGKHRWLRDYHEWHLQKKSGVKINVTAEDECFRLSFQKLVICYETIRRLFV